MKSPHSTKSLALRIDTNLKQAATIAAHEQRRSLTSFVAAAIEKAVLEHQQSYKPLTYEQRN